MSERKPTDAARVKFGQTQMMSANISYQSKDNTTIQSAASISLIAEGLADMTTGIRATYILLEEVKRLLERR